ncbi:AtpZ/AtpI family protein [Sphingomonas sp. PAMC 26605]|uniref:AtpZ/AtpI family protein n=1 Tax=Sphingomonas sp. PAMC 26605 TaxID=1112214 RepID=UPI00026CD237|nr:AtpZ/AtpI family protein [Sphingomonas sp. PAMC 26605]
MSALQTPPEDPLIASVRLRGVRRARWLRDGEDSVARRLAQIGVLGWITVIPMLTGIFAGRWLDRTYHSGIFWTAPLLMLGAGLGCWSAWRWIKGT